MHCDIIGRECKYTHKCSRHPNFIPIKTIKEDFKEVFYKPNIEKLLFEINRKNVIKIERVPTSEALAILETMPLPENASTAVYSIIEEVSFDDSYTENKYVNILVGKNKKVLRDFIHLDNSKNFIERVVGTGHLLGYPQCCIKNAVAMSRNIESLRNFENHGEEIFKQGVACPILMRKLRTYVHYPCTNNCVSTINNGEAVLEYIEMKHGEDVIDYFFNNANPLQQPPI